MEAIFMKIISILLFQVKINHSIDQWEVNNLCSGGADKIIIHKESRIFKILSKGKYELHIISISYQKLAIGHKKALLWQQLPCTAENWCCQWMTGPHPLHIPCWVCAAGRTGGKCKLDKVVPVNHRRSFNLFMFFF